MKKTKFNEYEIIDNIVLFKVKQVARQVSLNLELKRVEAQLAIAREKL